MKLLKKINFLMHFYQNNGIIYFREKWKISFHFDRGVFISLEGKD